MELIITKGLPASGKTTWAREWVNKDPKNRVRVNRDDIRKQLGPYWIPQREDLVTAIENEMILQAIDHLFSVVVDATNLRGITRFENLVHNHDLYLDCEIELKIKDFTDVPVKECIRRDMKREGDSHVGVEPIINMYKKYLKDD